jgi:hypothetical protein
VNVVVAGPAAHLGWRTFSPNLCTEEVRILWLARLCDYGKTTHCPRTADEDARALSWLVWLITVINRTLACAGRSPTAYPLTVAITLFLMVMGCAEGAALVFD